MPGGGTNRVESVDRKEYSVARRTDNDKPILNSGGGIEEEHVLGWRLTVRTDVLWHFECFSQGPRPVRYVVCVPDGGDHWKRVDFFEASNSASPEPKEYDYQFTSEDIFIFAEYPIAGEMHQVDANQGLTSAFLVDEARGVKLEWNFQSCIMNVISQ